MDKQRYQRRNHAKTVADDDDDDNVAAIVERAVQALYKRLDSGVAGTTAPSVKKVPTLVGHRMRTTSNNGAGADDYDDAAALAFLTAAVVDVVIGSSTSAESPSSPAPASSGSQNDGKCSPIFHMFPVGLGYTVQC